MTDRYRQHPYQSEDRSGGVPRDDGYAHPSYAPGRGYTPPLGSPPPPKNFFERVVYSVRNYFGLRRRARASSMQWWLLKLIQGLILGTPPGILGVGMIVGGSVTDSAAWIGGIGKALLLASALVFLWYALAPITQRWRVIIPEGEYWAVQDNNRYTLDFLHGGRQDVEWHWHAHVVKYIDFMRVGTTIRLDSVLITQDQRLSLDIHVIMHVDPTRAPQDTYAELRKMTRPEQFERQIDRHVRRVVLDALHHQTDRLYWLAHPSELEYIIQQALDDLTEWGLLPVPGRPVSIEIFSSPLPGGPLMPPATPATSPGSYVYDGPHQHTTMPTGPLNAPPSPLTPDTPPDDTATNSGLGDTTIDPEQTPDPGATAAAPDEKLSELSDPLDRRRKHKQQRRGET